MIIHHELGLSTDLDVLDQLIDVAGKFIIDAGCGDLNLAATLAQRGAHVLGIDPDPRQAKINNEADTVTNVGFAETTADKLPVEPGSVDGVVFNYSLHHIPKASYTAVFNEVRRVLKPDGFMLVVEPVPSGDLYQITQHFHDETTVRNDAQEALVTLAVPAFLKTETYSYHSVVQYRSFEQYANHYASLSYNEKYTEEEIRRQEVETLFEQLGAPANYTFERPMHVTFLQGLLVPA